VFRKSEVYNATLSRRHGLQGDGPSRGCDSLCHSIRQGRQGLAATFLVAGDVNEDVDPLLKAPACQKRNDGLKGPQGLSASPDEKTGVVAIDVEYGPAHVFAFGVLEVDDHRNSHPVDELLQNLGRHPDHVGSHFEKGYPDFCVFSADTEDARFAPANDVYFYFRALDV